MISAFIRLANGHGYPIGVPFWMQEANTMVSAPRRTSSLARRIAFLPGQPPQFIKPIMLISSFEKSAKAPLRCATARKSVVPGQKSSVCIQRMIPIFKVAAPSFRLGYYIMERRGQQENICTDAKNRACGRHGAIFCKETVCASVQVVCTVYPRGRKDIAVFGGLVFATLSGYRLHMKTM